MSYDPLPDFPYADIGMFFIDCDGRSIIGGGVDRGGAEYVSEFNRGKWKKLPSLNFARWGAAPCYFNKTLHVSGGNNQKNEMGYLDSIEFLDIDSLHTASQWQVCQSRLPCKVDHHSLSFYNGKLYLIGGYQQIWGSSKPSNKVWEGTFRTKNEIEWKEIVPMTRGRKMHFSVVLNNKLYVAGGESFDNYCSVEIFDGKSWSLGVEFSFPLSKGNGQEVVDREDLIIIITNDNGIIIYNTSDDSIEEFNNYTLRELRAEHGALLQ